MHQIENAIQIAWSNTNDHNLKSQAIEFVHQLRNDPTAWQICLPLFTQSPRSTEHVRHFCLEVLSNSAQVLQLQPQTLEYIHAQLLEYVHQNYTGEATGLPDSPHIQNKLSQVLTYLFAGLYPTTWQTFFDDFLMLSKNGANPVGTILYFRLLGSIHDEIADVMILRSPEDTKRNVALKDMIRERDASKVAAFWQELLSKWRQSLGPENTANYQIVEMCLRTISKWVSWTDISLVVNQVTLGALLEMASQQDSTPQTTKLRDAAIEAFTEIANKGMRSIEKVELLRALNLGTVVRGLIESPVLSQYRNTSMYDTDLAELVAKLVNNVVRDIVVVLDSADATPATKQEANEMLQTFVPFLLRFFADEYDEVCSTVIDGLSDILTFFRRLTKDKNGANTSLPPEYSALLPTILQAIINKMKYDETASFDEHDLDFDDEDEAEFQELRKRLNVLQQQITAIDERLSIMTISNLVKRTFQGVSAGNGSVDWRAVELALYELNIFGDFAARQTNRSMRVQQPGAAAEQLGQMIVEMMSSSKFCSSPYSNVELTISRSFHFGSPCCSAAILHKSRQVPKVL
jgi:exportin-T